MRLYDELADWFPLLTAPAEYASEADMIRRALTAAGVPDGALLELGAGGGNNASFLKAHYRCTLTDISAEMLRVSHRLNPECEHIAGDMRTLHLNRNFSAVLVHDAVCYMTNEADQFAAIRTAAEHLRAGGVAIFLPDHVRESYAAGTRTGGHDSADGSALRYLEWSWDPDPDDTTTEAHFALLLREAGAPIRIVHERHVFGLFPRSTWARGFREAGLIQLDLNVDDPHEVEHTRFITRKP